MPLESMPALCHFIAHSLVSFTLTWTDMIFDQILHRWNFRQKVRTLRHCNNTLPRGRVCWKIRPLRQSRVPRGANCRGGCNFQFILTRGSAKCIGSYLSNRWVVLTVYKFNTLPLYKKECLWLRTLEKS